MPDGEAPEIPQDYSVYCLNQSQTLRQVYYGPYCDIISVLVVIQKEELCLIARHR